MDHQEWLKARKQGLGGSDASIVTGHNRYKNPIQLWEEKLGLVPDEDLSDKPAVQLGINMEPILLDMFALAHPEYKVLPGLEMQWSEQFPWMYANTDGMLVDEDGRKGVLEIKTATVRNLKSWTKEIPQSYYLQILHYLAVTEADYAILYAWIRPQWEGGDTDAWLRKFVVEKQGREAEIQYLIEQEEKFWGYVQRGERPAFKAVIQEGIA